MQFVVVDRGGEVAVEDLESVIRRHVEGVLDALDRDITRWHSKDRVPSLARQQDLGCTDNRFVDSPSRDRSIGGQQSARGEYRPLRRVESIDDVLKLLNRRLERTGARGDV